MSKKTLYQITAIYFLLPNLLFFATWLNSIIAFFGVIFLIIASWSHLVAVKGSEESLGSNQNPKKIFLIALAASIIVTFFTGIGGVAPQSMDYIKHNLVFEDLRSSSWPVFYDSEKFLCYSLGYYLVPSLMAKFVPFFSVDMLSFVWALAGIMLISLWIMSNEKISYFRYYFLVIFYAGWCVVWLIVKKQFSVDILGIKFSSGGLHTDLRSAGLVHNYMDLYTKIHYTTQHAISALLLAVVGFSWVDSNRRKHGLAYLCALSLLWSPFASLGIFPIFLFDLIKNKKLPKTSLSEMISVVVCVVVVGAYYASHVPMGQNGWAWNLFDHSLSYWLILYFAFLVVNLFPGAVSIYILDRRYNTLGELRLLFYISFIFAAILPIYKIGVNNDFRQHCSTASILFLGMLFARSILHLPKSSRREVAPYVCFAIYLIGAIYPITRPVINLFTNRNNFSYTHTKNDLKINNLSEIANMGLDPSVNDQYLGNSNSHLYKILFKEVKK